MSYRLTILIIITVSVMLPIAVFASSPGLDTDQLAEDRLVAQDMTSRLLTFIENRGQWNSQTRFVAVTDNVAFWLRQNEVIYQFTKPSTSCNKTPDDLAIRVTFPGACSSPAVAGDNLCSLKCNYFVGRDPELWHTGVNNWEAVAYRDLYLGIDLVYRGNG
ncbi:MAG: hypothetical protein DRP45_05570 [Candidatus Zixiibacteriota bacterium]|nr:MAG: hypothetical protein DRP45_05570 [candidate division Zixibacteria bacterium]